MVTLILISVLGIISMMSEILGFKKFLWPIIFFGLIGTLAVTVGEWVSGPDASAVMYFDMMYFDNYAIAFSSLLIFLLLIWIFVSKDQYTKELNMSDNYALVLFAVAGAIALTSYWNLVLLFIGIEILSIPLYILAGSKKDDLNSNEASLKYFMMGAFTTGILLFGITLIYGATGSFDLGAISSFVTANQGELPTMFYTGIILLIIALGFKISAVPFHFWSPDVYQGSPMMVTAFMASIVKTAAFAAFYRLFSVCFVETTYQWGFILSGLIILTILTGNILATGQTNVKRMLAYSGISQAGYMMMALLVLNNDSTNALLFYAGSYSLATLAAFAVCYTVSKVKQDESIDSFNALGKTHPLLALVLTVSMLSLAGIPPAVGFFAKFYLFATVLQQGYTGLVIIAVIGSLISVYYYFKLIIAMYGKEAEPITININFVYKTVLVIVTSLIVMLGITPDVFIDVISK